jgi:uncharacterized protein YbjT (DUF2867 family)
VVLRRAPADGQLDRYAAVHGLIPGDLGPLIPAGQPRGVAGWPYIDVLDLAEAVRRAVDSDLPGQEAFYIAAPGTVEGIDLHASWRTANPGSATDLRPVLQAGRQRDQLR